MTVATELGLAGERFLSASTTGADEQRNDSQDRRMR